MELNESESEEVDENETNAVSLTEKDDMTWMDEEFPKRLSCVAHVLNTGCHSVLDKKRLIYFCA